MTIVLLKIFSNCLSNQLTRPVCQVKSTVFAIVLLFKPISMTKLHREHGVRWFLLSVSQQYLGRHITNRLDEKNEKLFSTAILASCWNRCRCWVVLGRLCQISRLSRYSGGSNGSGFRGDVTSCPAWSYPVGFYQLQAMRGYGQQLAHGWSKNHLASNWGRPANCIVRRLSWTCWGLNCNIIPHKTEDAATAIPYAFQDIPQGGRNLFSYEYNARAL